MRTKDRGGLRLGTLSVFGVLVLGAALVLFGFGYWFPSHPITRSPRLSLVDRFDLPDGEGSSDGSRPPGAELRVADYGFENGLGAWRVIQGDSSLEASAGVLRIRNGKGLVGADVPRLPTVLSLPLDGIDAGEITHVRVNLKLSPGDFRPLLAWGARTPESPETLGGQVRFSCSQGKLVPVLIPVADEANWRGKISSLSLTGVPVPGEAWELGPVELLRFESGPRRARFRSGPMTRDAIVGKVPYSVDISDLSLHRYKTRLRFDLAVRGGEGTRVRVRLENRLGPGESVVLWEKLLAPTATGEFESCGIDLAELIREQQFDLRFGFEIAEAPSQGGRVEAAILAPALEYSVRDWNRPNLILISLDTLRADHLGCYGYSRDTSPFLDRLASQGTVFENATSQAPETLASTMTLLTGRYPSNHRVFRAAHRLGDESATLAYHLRENGYQTAAFVEGGFVESPYGFDLGFDLYHNGIKPPVGSGGDVKNTFGRARSWLEKNDDRSFFLFLHTYQIHTPYAPPEEFRKKFVDPDYDGGLRHELFDDRLARRLLDRTVGQKLTEADREYITALYDGEVAYVDSVLEEFFKFLGERGRLQDTFVLITSDHGEDLGDHNAVGLHGHTLHRAVTHVPFIAYGHALKGDLRVPVRRCAAKVGGIDVAPTLLELGGVDAGARDGMQGMSLLPFFAQDEHAEGFEREIYSEDLTNFVRTAILSRDEKYVHTLGYERHRGELVRALQPGLEWFFTSCVPDRRYDLESDPAEQMNLYGQDPAADERLRKRIFEFREKMKNAPAPRRSNATMDEAQRKRLKLLGYVEEAEEEAVDGFDLISCDGEESDPPSGEGG